MPNYCAVNIRQSVDTLLRHHSQICISEPQQNSSSSCSRSKCVDFLLKRKFHWCVSYILLLACQFYQNVSWASVYFKHHCSLWTLEWLYVRRNLLLLEKSYSPGGSTNVPERRFQTDEAFRLRKRWVFELPLKAYESLLIA